jgi:signal transduction histidine kinase
MGIAVPAAGVTVPAGRGRGTLALALAAVAAATAVAAAVAATGTAGDPALVALGRAAIVAVPCGVGLYARQRWAGTRFGTLLIAAGAIGCVAALAEARTPGAYAVGRVAAWMGEVMVVVLILAFPTGRLPARVDRLIVAATAATIAVAFLPRLVLAARFEVPSPATSCTRDCPPNPLFALGAEPAFVGDVLRPVGVVLVGLVMLAVVARVWRRAVEATPPARGIFAPVFAVAVTRAVLLGGAIAVRLVAPDAPGLAAAAWLLALALPALALAFLAGLVRWGLFTGGALARLAVALREDPDRATLRRAFVTAFRDPRADVVFPDPSASSLGWVDAAGAPARLPAPGSGRAVTVIDEGGRPAAAIVHDTTLRAEPLLMRAGAAIAATALERRRLADEVGTAMREVRRSRARIAAGADRERRRLERDLHDGAQQRLVALRIELELAEELVRRDPHEATARLHRLGADVDEAIDELRALAHGVYPPVLADRGLADALREATRRSPVPVDVAARGVGRHPAEIESAVYYCVLEACQNALKHAAGAHRVAVELHETSGDLHFSVRDDGIGFAPADPAAGAGMANMRDRVAAAGGELEIASARHVGTLVRGRVPVKQDVS